MKYSNFLSISIVTLIGLLLIFLGINLVTCGNKLREANQIKALYKAQNNNLFEQVSLLINMLESEGTDIEDIKEKHESNKESETGQ